MSLPEGWRETTLGEISIKKQYGYTESASLEKVGPKFLRITDIQEDFINWETVPYCPISDNNYKKYKLSKGDIVVARTGNSTGATATIKTNSIEAVFASYLIRFQIESTKADYNFIDFILRSFYWKGFVKSIKGGSAQGGANANDFAGFPINLPPLQEQKAIANILSSFDEKIELLKEQNETLEQMAQGVFREWLSENNSEDWEYKKLEEVLEISSSKRIFSKEYVEVGIPFYRSKEIIELSTKPNITTELYITEERFQEIKNKFSVPLKGDILLTSVGTLGVSYQVRDDKPFYFKDGNLTWFKNFSNVVSSDYVYLWLKLKSTQHKLNEVSIGSTQKALTIGSLRTLEIPILKDENKAQELFDFIKIQLDKVNHNYEQIQTLQKTRDTLLPKLMSGELEVLHG